MFGPGSLYLCPTKSCVAPTVRIDPNCRRLMRREVFVNSLSCVILDSIVKNEKVRGESGWRPL